MSEVGACINDTSNDGTNSLLLPLPDWMVIEKGLKEGSG